MIKGFFGVRWQWSLLVILFAFTGTVWGQNAAMAPHIKVELISEHHQLKQGTNWLGLYLQPDPHWHTYWRNPGDSGEAPVLNWQLPEGIIAGDVQWPIPKSIPVAHLVNYGYESNNLLMVPIEIPDSAFVPGKSVQLNLEASWLVCKEDCIPGWANLSLTLPMSHHVQPSAVKPLFDETRKSLPKSSVIPALHEVNDSHIVVSVNQALDGNWQLLPFESGVIQHNQFQQVMHNESSLTLVLARSEYFTTSSNTLSFLLTNGSTGYYLKSEFNGLPNTQESSLIILLIMAFAGGLILNLMPCVLPVLSIKVLSFGQSSVKSSIGLAYTAGVFVSFNLFAVAILAFKQGGDAVGWGFHMQSPWVVGALAYLFILITLSMLDLVSVGGRFAGIGQKWIKDDGVSSQFFTGVLAVLVASPCTAPFMAAALGVALVSDVFTSLAIFNALALGFALPLAVLSWSPALQRWLPKPGPWMVTFRQFLAFPMLATVIWLLWVFVNQTDSISQALLLVGLLLFSLFIWLLNKVSSTYLKMFAVAALVISVVMPLALHNTNTQSKEIVTSNGRSQAFTPEKLASLKANEQVVLVNMTADWCITCKVNEQVAFASDEFQTMMDNENVHYLVGDWTNRNDAILNYLTQYQRAGVPLYVVYAGSKSKQVLPQILTPDTVVDALKLALGETQNEG